MFNTVWTFIFILVDLHLLIKTLGDYIHIINMYIIICIHVHCVLGYVGAIKFTIRLPSLLIFDNNL